MSIASEIGDGSPLPVRLASGVVPPPRCSFSQAREYLLRGSRSVEIGAMTYGPDIASGQTGRWTLEMPSLPSRRAVDDGECDAWVKMKLP